MTSDQKIKYINRTFMALKHGTDPLSQSLGEYINRTFMALKLEHVAAASLVGGILIVPLWH
jgi:hypothetical protein